MSVDLATLALKVEALEVDAASRKLDNLTAAGGRTEKAAGGMSTAFRALGAALATVQLANMIKESALMAARYETMGAAMVTVGNNAGYTGSQMAEYEKRLRSTGIAMIESRETLTKMAASHIDLAKATDLARIAQDAAVAGNINSSEAFDRMINGIRSAEVEVLRGIGLNVNFEQSYAKLADQLGKNAKDLTETEKGQARVNSVLAAGTGIAGTYEAAMGTAGKMLNSMQRYADDLKVSLGAAFGPAVTLLVDQMTGALKDANSEVRDGQSTIDAWGVKFRSAIISIEAELIRLSMLIDKVGGTMTAVLTGAGELIDVVSNIKGAVSDMYSGVDSGWAESELTKLGKQWNKVYEDRYKAGDKALQDLADLESKLTNEVKGGTSAQEQARIAAGKNGRTLVQNEEARSAALKKAEEGAKKARSAAEASAKASAQEYQSNLDSLEPVRVEQEEYNKALAVLNKMDPTHETERYKAGLEQLNSTLSANIELEEYRKNIIGQRADYEKQVAQASMTDAEIRIDNINRELLALEEYGQRLVGLGEAEQSVVDANNAAFGERARKQIEAITDDAGEMGKMFDDVAKSIQGAFSDMFLDMMNDTDNAMDSIGDMFKKLLAQMATMAIAKPIIIPMIVSVGSAMGMSNASIASAAGTDASTISGMNLSGLGSLFSSGSLQSMGVSSMGSVSSFAYDIGFDSLGSLAADASDFLAYTSAGLADGLVAGVGSLAMSLLSAEGLTVQTGMQASGAALGASFGGPVGAVLGGMLGSVVGGMFGTGEDTFGPQYMANDVGVNYNATTGMTPTTKQYTGGDTDSQIAKVYAEQMRSIQAAFDDQVTALAEALPDEISSAMLGSLAAADLKQILNNVSGQEINVADAASWMEGVAAAYSEGLLAELGKAYGSALSSFISTNGAEGLVGDSAAWGMLTEAVKQNITDSFQSAASTIAGGDTDAGLSTINSVTNAIAAIESAMAPITEIIATDGLTEYEKSIRSINIQFDNYAAALKSAGVDMEKYTDLEKARGIALSQVVNPAIQEAIDKEKELSDARKGVDDPVSEIIATSGMSDYEKQIRSINQQFDDYRDTLKASQGTQAELDRVEQARAISLSTVVMASVKAAKESEIELAKTRLSAAESNLQAAESNLQAAFSAEQERADKAHQEALESFNSTLTTTKESLSKMSSLSSTLNSALNGMQANGSVVSDLEQRQMAQTSLTAALAAARGGDFSLASSLSSDNIGTLTKSSEDLFATRAEYEADYLKTYSGLSELKSLSDAQVTDAEKTVALLEQQINDETARYDWQKGMLSDQLKSITGIDNSVMSLSDAITAYQEAKTASDVLALEYARLQLDATNNLASTQYAVSSAINSAASSDGGLSLNLSTNSTPNNSGNTDILAEVAALRAEMRAAMTAIAANTKKTATMADKWDNDGMPEVRT